MAILQFPQLVGRPLLDRAARSGFANRALAAVRDAIGANADGAESSQWLEVVTAAVPQPLAQLVQQLAIAPLPQQPGEEALGIYVRDVTSRLVDRDLQRKKTELLGQLQRTRPAEEPERYRGIQRDLVTLEAERRSLREG
jgi:DNA primase